MSAAAEVNFAASEDAYHEAAMKEAGLDDFGEPSYREALGKSISGGHPISVVCGVDEIMRYAEGVRRLTGDYVSLTGTFSGNPISCAVALAIVRELEREGAYEALFARGRRLMEACERHLGEAGVPVRIMGEPPAFQPWFCEHEIVDFRTSQLADKAKEHQFAQLLLDRGVLKAHEKFFVSMVHDDADIEYTIDAIAEAAEAMADRHPNQ